MMSTLETISTGHGLLEAPLWHAGLGLLASDAVFGGVWAFGSGAPPQPVVAHRRGIGGMALHADGGLVMSGRNLAHKRLPEQPGATTRVLLDNDAAAGAVGYNDLVTDAAGRLYVGSVAFVASDPAARAGGPPGKLFLIDLDGNARVVADDVLLTNGLGLSPDGRRLYHADSLRHAVFGYDVQTNGDLGPKRLFVETGVALPDGLAVDAAGTVWVALAGAGRVAGYAPDGREVASIALPVPMVTSLCFGSADLRDLYIVTGSEGLATDRGGGVYRTRADVPGLPRPPARVGLR